MFLPNIDISAFISPYECPVHHFLHIYCPSCGGTRSVLSLLKGDVMASLQYNPVVMVAIFYGLAMLLFLGLEKAGKMEEMSARRSRKVVTIAFFAVWIGYGIVRDAALLAFGIDWVGDFS